MFINFCLKTRVISGTYFDLSRNTISAVDAALVIIYQQLCNFWLYLPTIREHDS